MSKQYKLKSHMAGYAAGDTITADDIKERGWDANDLVRRGAIESVRSADADDDEGRVGDEANKERIEQAIRDETVKAGRPLEEHERNKIAADVTKESAAQTKDATKAESKEQQQANAAAAKGDATKPPRQQK